MWSSRRGILLGAVALGACGFTPIYGPGGGEALWGAIRAEDPSDTESFAFVQAFEARLGLPASARFRLTYEIEVTETGQAITGSNDITRFTVDGIVRYQLFAISAEAPLLSGEVQSFTSYSAGGSTLATLSAQRDARARLMRILAEQISTRLLAASALR